MKARRLLPNLGSSTYIIPAPSPVRASNSSAGLGLPVPVCQRCHGYEFTRLTAQASRGVIPGVVSLAPISLELRPCYGAALFSPFRSQHGYKPDTETDATNE